jgi:NCAIR mutase (PurE)-related protein
MIEFSSMKSYLKEVLKKVQEGKLSVEKALDTLKDYPYQDLSFAKVDHHRELRRGFPEIIYGLGKTKEQIIEIAKAILKAVL